MSIHGGTRMDSKQAARAVIFDRRLLAFCIATAVLVLLVWSAALATDYWSVTSCKGGVAVSETGVPGLPEAYLMSARAGLWRTCKTLLSNATSPPGEGRLVTACRYNDLVTISGLPTNHTINVAIEYRRTCLALAVISVVLLLLAIFFSVYTLRVPRYTFKRMSACLYFITAAVELVLLQVHEYAIRSQELGLPAALPVECLGNYSFSYILAWICFIVNLLCGVGFFYTSCKKKKRVEAGFGNDAGFGDFDEPQIMGR